MGRVLITIDLDYWIPDIADNYILTQNLINAAASDDYEHGRSNKDILHGEQSKTVECHCPYMILTKKYLFLWLVVTK